MKLINSYVIGGLYPGDYSFQANDGRIVSVERDSNRQAVALIESMSAAPFREFTLHVVRPGSSVPDTARFVQSVPIGAVDSYSPYLIYYTTK